ncbi:unnamed protein product [Darwinula stevensoni]|uniref:Uncharacterized protein n=1 Tax=Darwinula stevensoni TaxID=69355 RepID=A0A7R9AGQ5_9CRUS|nr:unnamed protein product [Darwinula stevensoni]CAG0903658.1 unnamed protein product [Darwinula stevensoni]
MNVFFLEEAILNKKAWKRAKNHELLDETKEYLPQRNSKGLEKSTLGLQLRVTKHHQEQGLKLHCSVSVGTVYQEKVFRTITVSDAKRGHLATIMEIRPEAASASSSIEICDVCEGTVVSGGPFGFAPGPHADLEAVPSRPDSLQYFGSEGHRRVCDN